MSRGPLQLALDFRAFRTAVVGRAVAIDARTTR